MSNLRKRIKAWASQPATSADMIAFALMPVVGIVTGLIIILAWGSQ
tara:strand:+ start:556 stop:693 length:138 start_codon:yes stop_codon:yes gene_type:complete